MSEKKVLDLSQKLIAAKIKEGPSYVYCRVCGSEEHGFAARGRFNAGGAYYIEKLICLSPDCMGETEIDIIGGFVA